MIFSNISLIYTGPFASSMTLRILSTVSLRVHKGNDRADILTAAKQSRDDLLLLVQNCWQQQGTARPRIESVSWHDCLFIKYLNFNFCSCLPSVGIFLGVEIRGAILPVAPQLSVNGRDIAHYIVDYWRLNAELLPVIEPTVPTTMSSATRVPTSPLIATMMPAATSSQRWRGPGR